jgi:hypothetical protein
MDYHKSHCPLQTFWGDEFQNAIIVSIATAVTVASTALAAAALPALPALEASAEVMSAVGPLDDGAGQTMRAVPPAAAAEQRVLAVRGQRDRRRGGGGGNAERGGAVHEWAGRWWVHARCTTRPPKNTCVSITPA